MTKLLDSIREALTKKHAANHPGAKAENTKTKTPGPAAAVANKPQKKVTGRGR